MTARDPQRLEVDVAIVGAGFAGALMALALRRRGRSVALLERGRHPRFAIGESSTPLANLLLEQLCDRYGLPAVRPFSQWGTWQRATPDVGCGLKRGFSFFHHEPGQPFADDSTHGRQLLVAASPHDEVADTHWYRPDVDAWLVEHARQAGVSYRDEVTLHGIREGESHVCLDGTRGGQSLDVRAQFVVDASGPRGFLHGALGLKEMPLQWLPPTHTLYAHVRDVGLWQDTAGIRPHDVPPYPVDAAALHHVFPGGWIWVLRFNNGITSAGAALTDAVAEEVGAADGADGWVRLLARYPSIRAQFAQAHAVTPFVHARRLAFRSRQVVGERWALLPSAAGVIDPLLSTGFPLALLGVHRLLAALDAHWQQPALRTALDAYAAATRRELDATEQLVGALYASMQDVELFKRLTLLYFAAASFSETAWRLGRPELAPGFLLCDDAVFGEELRACTAEALGRPQGTARAALLARIDSAIAPIDMAGLGDRARRDWYPVRAEDVQAARAKVGASEAEMRALLMGSGLACAHFSRPGTGGADADAVPVTASPRRHVGGARS
jgi:tetracycline 7-halogenase / FADH2 O2-dependent halogenase